MPAKRTGNPRNNARGRARSRLVDPMLEAARGTNPDFIEAHLARSNASADAVPPELRIKAGLHEASDALLTRFVETSRESFGNLPTPEEELRIRAARDDPAAFCEYVLKDPKDGSKLKLQPFQRKWFDHIQGSKRAYIEAPRDHGKSALIAIGYVLWRMGRDPSIRIKLLCQSDTTSKKRLAAVKQYIERDPDLRRVFPNLKAHATVKDWGAFSITVQRPNVDKDPTLEALGVLSTGTGGRADLILGDDVVDERNAIAQPKMRETVKESWSNVWVNLLEPDGQVVFICTPWHSFDLTQELKKGKDGVRVYDVLSQSVGPNLESIWPDKWTKDALAQRLKELGRRRFDRAFRNLVYSDEELLFPAEVVDRAISRVRSYADIPTQGLRKYLGVDLAISKAKDAAYTVLFNGAVDENGYRYPLRVVRKRMSSVATAAWVLGCQGAYEPEITRIENNQYQGALIEWIDVFITSEYVREGRRPKDITPREWAWLFPNIKKAIQLRLRIEPCFTGKQKSDVEVGIPGLAAEFEGGLWRIYLGPGHNEDCECGLCIWINELKTFPAGRFSDTVMASWFMQTGIRGGGKISLEIDGVGDATPGAGGGAVPGEPLPTHVSQLFAIAGVDESDLERVSKGPRDTCGSCIGYDAKRSLCLRQNWLGSPMRVKPTDAGCDVYLEVEQMAAEPVVDLGFVMADLSAVEESDS